MDMSKITAAMPPVEADGDERFPAASGFMIAVGISLALWSLIGLAIMAA